MDQGGNFFKWVLLKNASMSEKMQIVFPRKAKEEEKRKMNQTGS